MIDREKVINALEDYEPYAREFDSLSVYGWVVLDALALLKEQEAVEPYSMNAEKTYGICPRCGKIIFRYGNVEENHYCGVCGKKVKWE